MMITPAQRAQMSQLLAMGAEVSREAVAKIHADVELYGEAETVSSMLISLLRLPPNRIADVAVAALFTLAREQLPEPGACPDPAAHKPPASPGRCGWCKLPVDGSLPTKGPDQ